MINRLNYLNSKIWKLSRIKACYRTLSHQSCKNKILIPSVEDVDARVEGFWFRGGIQPDKSMIKKREGLQVI